MTAREWFVAAILLTIGCATMAGDILGIRPLKAFGLATAASPAPKVFTAQDGFETYANRFYLDWHDASGAQQTLELTPAIYAGLAGPYNRRNVYGAVFSYAPVLDANPITRPMFRRVLQRSFCGERPVTSELSLPPEAARHGPVQIRLEPRGTHDQSGFVLLHQVSCDGR
jgi:hypothetical protein